jgi:hypothetical protein
LLYLVVCSAENIYNTARLYPGQYAVSNLHCHFPPPNEDLTMAQSRGDKIKVGIIAAPRLLLMRWQAVCPASSPHLLDLALGFLELASIIYYKISFHI